MTTLVTAFVVNTLAVVPLVAQELDSVQVHAGAVDIEAFVSGERSLPLSEPTVAIEPAFDEDIKSYAVRAPYGVEGVTLVVEAFGSDEIGVVDFNGAEDGFTGLTYERRGYGGRVIPFRLQLGDNHLQLGVVGRFRGSAIYEFVITRPDEPSGDTTLSALELGVGELLPAFDRNTRSYRTRVVGYSLTVTPTLTTGSVTVGGTGADGTALDVDGDTVSGLKAGLNTITLVVTAEDGMSGSYTLTAEASDDVREVAAGDVISRPGDCDRDIGCDGTLNGVDGRFACVGADLSSETGNTRVSFVGACLMSVSDGGVVDFAAGWAFAAFPLGSGASRLRVPALLGAGAVGLGLLLLGVRRRVLLVAARRSVTRPYEDVLQ